jgi:hypothetical protein
MTEFRILKEETFSYKGGKLYLMLLKDFDKFGVEVVDRIQTFGRKYAKDRKEAEYLFDIITKRLNTYKDIDVATCAIKRCFARKNLNETMFLLVAEERITSQTKIGRMVKKFKLNVEAKVGYFRDSRKKGAITIYIYFGGKVFGRFYGTRFSDDFSWEVL